MKVYVHSDQQSDGGFKYYVVFGDDPPWIAKESNVFECQSEADAFRLKDMVSLHSGG